MGSRLTVTTFDNFLRGVASVTNGQGTVDLGDVEFVTPGGMMLLAFLTEQLCRQCQSAPTLCVPDDSVRSYLNRAGFFSHFDNSVVVLPPLDEDQVLIQELRRGTTPMLLELASIGGMKDIPPLLDGLLATLTGEMNYGKRDAYDLCIVTSEISQNIFDHNGGDVHGLVAMQVYSGRGQFLELALGDCGQGIRRSLAANPMHSDVSSDVDAILRSIRPGVSEYQDQTRGNGLHLLMDRVFTHQGSVTIRSGTGKVHVRMDKKTGWPFAVPDLRGTQVVVTLPQKGG